MFRLNFKIVLRNLWKHKFFSLINIGGLAIGLASCLLLLLYVNYEHSYDQQFKNIDRIYGVAKNWSNGIDQQGTHGTIGYALPATVAPTALQTMPGVAYASRFRADYKLVNYNQNSFRVNVTYADPSFLNILDYQFISGNPAHALHTPNSILLTASTAKRLFGDSNPIGKIITWEDREGLKVTAVIADLPGNQSIQFDALLNWDFFIKENDWAQNTSWQAGFCNTLILLKEGADFSAADAVLRKMIQSHAEDDKFTVPFLFPFSKTHLYTEFENGKAVGGKIDQVNLFLFFAFCILLIACINYMNLSTAQSEKRAREVGLRKALGSTRSAIAGQFILASLLLSTLSMIVAFSLLEVVLPFFNNLLNIQLSIHYTSLEFIGLVIGMVLFTGLLAGSYPSFYLSSFIPIKVLKGFKNIGNSSLSIRKILVIVQFGFSVCMIICATIVYQQISFLQNKPLGFNQENLVQIEKSGVLKEPQKLEQFKKELISSGAVSVATEYSTGMTNNSHNSSDIIWAGHPDHGKYSWNIRASGYDFVKTIGGNLLAGRDFSPKFSTDSNAVLINEAAAKVFEFKNPVGMRFRKAGKTYTIIGLIKDYAYASSAQKVKPTLTFLAGSEPEKRTAIVMLRLNSAQNLSRSVEQIRTLSLKMNPSYPPEQWFVSQELMDQLNSEKLLSTLSNLFSGFAIFISCLGLLGLAIYMSEQRSKEISIRKVLGADIQHLILLLNKDFMKLVLIANLLACPAAYIIADKWLQQYDYRISLSIWPMLITLLMSIFIAVLTVSIQTLKVVRANPVDALKYE